MTTALAALLICIAGAALVIAIGTYFWVNRAPSTRERFDRYGRVPLFGVTLTTNTPNGTPVISTLPDSAMDSADDSVEDEPKPAASSNGSGLSSLVSSPGAQLTPSGGQPAFQSFAPPPQPGLADSSATQGTTVQPTPPRSSPPTAQRPGGNGWGDRPGWPVPAPTPAMPDATGFNPQSAVTPFGRQSTPVTPISHVSANGTGTPASNGAFNSANGNGVFADGVPGSMVEGHGLRFSVPAEGTLQFLPGRLQISAGLDAGREIRFVRVPGPNGTEVTFGRNEGPLYRHIQLRDQTVSREHARMTLFEGQWSLANLSRTNPVALNGRILGLGEQQTLQDGDRVEMGEVVFSFRSR